MPLGDSPRYCLSLLQESTKDKRAAPFELEGQDPCYGSQKGHGAWPATYPKTGLNFRTWMQVASRDNKDKVLGDEYLIDNLNRLDSNSVEKGS